MLDNVQSCDPKSFLLNQGNEIFALINHKLHKKMLCIYLIHIFKSTNALLVVACMNKVNSVLKNCDTQLESLI